MRHWGPRGPVTPHRGSVGGEWRKVAVPPHLPVSASAGATSHPRGASWGSSSCRWPLAHGGSTESFLTGQRCGSDVPSVGTTRRMSKSGPSPGWRATPSPTVGGGRRVGRRWGRPHSPSRRSPASTWAEFPAPFGRCAFAFHHVNKTPTSASASGKRRREAAAPETEAEGAAQP